MGDWSCLQATAVLRVMGGDAGSTGSAEVVSYLSFIPSCLQRWRQVILMHRNNTSRVEAACASSAKLPDFK
ncbi:unnamed protein product [Urochloa humidicola]